LLYRWGNPQSYRAGYSNDQKLYHVHDAQWIENGFPGAGNILYFNNGVGRPEGRYSSVEEIDPPVSGNGNYLFTPGLSYGPDEPEWIYVNDNPTDFFSGGQSGAQRLPNGNTLICEADDGKFFEISQNENIIWGYTNPYPILGGNQVFKIQRYSPSYPGINIILDNYSPNDPPIPEGTTFGYTDIEYDYSTKAIDPNNDDIQYGWDWNGDNKVDEWTDYYHSDETCILSHSWDSPNTYKIKVNGHNH
jgi:hypothetical protein